LWLIPGDFRSFGNFGSLVYSPAFVGVVTNKPHVYSKPKFHFALMPGHDCIKGRERHPGNRRFVHSASLDACRGGLLVITQTWPVKNIYCERYVTGFSIFFKSCVSFPSGLTNPIMTLSATSSIILFLANAVCSVTLFNVS